MAMQTVTTTIESVIWVAPNRQGGEPCFINTGVPIKTLFEYLAEGEPLDDFLRGFPTITREPELAPDLPELRQWRIKGFKDYLIFYLPLPDGVEIVRVIHGKRNIPTLLSDEERQE